MEERPGTSWWRRRTERPWLQSRAALHEVSLVSVCFYDLFAVFLCFCLTNKK